MFGLAVIADDGHVSFYFAHDAESNSIILDTEPSTYAKLACHARDFMEADDTVDAVIHNFSMDEVRVITGENEHTSIYIQKYRDIN